MPQLDAIDPGDWSPGLVDVIEVAPMPGLAAGPSCQRTASGVEELLRGQPTWRDSCLEAGLWLLAGDLERSHRVSQDLPGSDGAFWHGIMHRREGDYGNAKYWFGRVGQHPALEALARRLEARQGDLRRQLESSRQESLPGGELPWEKWTSGWAFDPGSRPGLGEALVDWVARSVRHGDPLREILELVCWWEWQLLLEASFDPRNEG